MRCSKCGYEDSSDAPFCKRCHAPRRVTCPACRNVQDHGGQCDRCGVDFTKYTAMLVFRAFEEAQGKRTAAKKRASFARQVFLAPLTGGLSLLKLVLSRLRGGG